MTIPKVKCTVCGSEGEHNTEIYGGLCQDCATIQYYRLQKNELKKVIQVRFCSICGTKMEEKWANNEETDKCPMSFICFDEKCEFCGIERINKEWFES